MWVARGGDVAAHEGAEAFELVCEVSGAGGGVEATDEVFERLHTWESCTLLQVQDDGRTKHGGEVKN